MTSVDWIIEQLDELIPYEGITASQVFADVIAKAQAMHKAEIIAAYMDRIDCTDKEVFAKIIGEEYYQKTFKQD